MSWPLKLVIEAATGDQNATLEQLREDFRNVAMSEDADNR